MNLYFTFEKDGTSTLYWDRTGESGFCERKGHYSVDQSTEPNILNDEIDWVNPKNNMDCGQDPDMQHGKKSSNAISLADGKFHLEVGLAGEPFTYIFEKFEQAPSALKK